MSDNSNEGNRPINHGVNRTFLHGFLFGIPLVIVLVVAYLEHVGTIRLAEYFAPDRPESVDEGVIYLALVLTAALLAFFGGTVVVRGLIAIRRAKNFQR